MTALRHTIHSGDTLSHIALHINNSKGITYQDILMANPNITATALQVGEVIDIPTTTGSTNWRYTILAGDTLSHIAEGINKAAGITYQQIEAANPGLSPTSLQIGEVIDIPEFSVSVELPAIVQAANIGYWDWTWSPTTPVPGATMGIAFSGWANIDNIISQSARVKNDLVGDKYISLGGGAVATGSFTAAFLNKVNAAIEADKLAGYDGLAYDIEVGDSGLSADFAVSFAAAKAKGFKVLVTISHSAPYGISDGASLMEGFFTDDNIDFLSPQLYTSGKESENDFADPRLPWSAYAKAKAKIIPSIVKAAYYPAAVSYFKNQGVTLEGYIQWAKTS